MRAAAAFRAGSRAIASSIDMRALGACTAIAARVRPTRRALRYFDQVEWDEDSSAAGTQTPPL